MEFKDILLSDFLRDWVTTIACLSSPPSNPQNTHWRKPLHGVLKLNFDRASKSNPGLADFRCVIRDCNVDICRVCCGPLEAYNLTRAETMGMFMGMRKLKSMEASGTIIEGDLVVVIGWGQGKECKSWQLWSLVYKIIEMSLDIGCSFSQFPWEQNSLVDNLANWGGG